jgi:hypothetical protein
MRTNQYELPKSGDVFNLVVEQGDDPWRLEREQWAAAEAAREAREYSARMQKTFEQCPGFIGADAPSGPHCTGKVMVDPARVGEAREWLKRRFHVAENIELSTGNSLLFEIAPRVRNKSGGGKRVVVRFGKPQQFALPLD